MRLEKRWTAADTRQVSIQRHLRPMIGERRDIGRVSSDRQKRVCSYETRSQHEHIQEFQLFHEEVSEASERAREWSKRAKQASQSGVLRSE